MSRDLEQTARNIIWEILQHEKPHDLDAIRDKVDEYAHSAADSAVTYYHWAEEVIHGYESHPGADGDMADDAGATYKPSEYREAMQAYAFWIARGVIEAEASDAIDEIEDAIATLREECAKLGMCSVDLDIRLSADCPHGWAAHDRETDSGACLWVSRQLDGCNAVAIKAGPLWASHTYNPAALAA